MKKIIIAALAVIAMVLVSSCSPEPGVTKAEISIPAWAWGDWTKSGATFHIDETNISMGGANIMMVYNMGNANGSLKVSQSESMEGTTKVYVLTGVDKDDNVMSNTIKLTESGVLSIYVKVTGTTTPFEGYTRN